MATTLTFLTRQLRWIHIRAQEKSGRKVSLSFPIPLNMATSILRYARRRATGDNRYHLENAEQILRGVRETGASFDEPILFQADDDNGSSVQVYIG